MQTYSIRHVTTYRYGAPVAFGPHRMMLRPRESFDQRTTASKLVIEPVPSEVLWSEDASGNAVGTARFARRANLLRFDVVTEVEHRAFDPATSRPDDYARAAPFSYGAEQMPDLARFIERQHPDPEHAVDRWARRILAEDPAGETWPFLVRLNAVIRRDFAYLRREEKGLQGPAQTLHLGHGSCRDFAVLMCEALRALGFAARFVSGYLHVRGSDPIKRLSGGNTHAWLQVYLPGAGWIDFDPTSGGVGNADLIRVAVVRDPAQAAPLTGSFIGFPSDFLQLEVSVQVSEHVARDAPNVVVKKNETDRLSRPAMSRILTELTRAGGS